MITTKRPKNGTTIKGDTHERRAAVQAPPRRPGAPLRERVAFGGVAAEPHGNALHGQEAAAEYRGRAPVDASFPGFVYNGGPVVTCPLAYVSFWGSAWLNDPGHIAAAARLTQFVQDLGASDYMNPLAQYGAGFGAGSGLFIQASFVTSVAANLSNSDIVNNIQALIDNAVLPEPPANNTSNILLIYLDEFTDVNDAGLGIVMCEPSGDTAFGYHDFFVTRAGNPFYYAVIPSLTDTCLTESCPGGDAGCSLKLTETQEQRRTQVTSHEYAEMITDPQLNAWYDPAFGECGDLCNGETDTIVGASGNVWNVQPEYSKFDDLQSNGAIYCVTQAPAPYPRLSPGPSRLAASAEKLRSMSVLLPLPAVQFDIQTGAGTYDEKHIRRFVKDLFRPLRAHHIVSDFPQLLHSIASVLEKGREELEV